MTRPTSSFDRVVCYIRRTKQWAENYTFSDEHRRVWYVDLIAQAWDETFTTPYADIRRRLHNLQRDNLSEVPFDATVEQYEYRGDHATIVPTDDDDWFHPDVVATLKRVRKPLVYWNFINYTNGVVAVQDSTKARVQFESNNYAATNFTDQDVLNYHSHANKLYRNSPAATHINACLSMHNRTMASLGLLSEKLINLKTGMLELYDLSRQTPKVVGDVPTYFMKYVDATVNLFRNELRVRKTFV